MKHRRSQRGFSLLETLVASLILSGTVVTVAALSTRALQSVGQQKLREEAVYVADRQLRLIDYMGIEQFLEQGQTEGFIEKPDPGFMWNASAEYLDVGELYSVVVTVTWMDQGKPRSFSLSTRMNGAGTMLTATEGDESGGGR